MDKSILIGLGFDCKDGQKRITIAEGFRLYGGSKQTHVVMREKCTRFNEVMKKAGKTLDKISIDEFYDISHKVGLKVPRKRF